MKHDVDCDRIRNATSLDLSDEKMREIEAAIEADRKKLAIEKDMDENERRRLEDELAKRESDLQMEKYELYSLCIFNFDFVEMNTIS